MHSKMCDPLERKMVVRSPTVQGHLPCVNNVFSQSCFSDMVHRAIAVLSKSRMSNIA